MKTPGQIVAEIRAILEYGMDDEEANQSEVIIKAAIEEALAERPDGMKSGGVQRMDEQQSSKSIKKVSKISHTMPI